MKNGSVKSLLIKRKKQVELIDQIRKDLNSAEERLDKFDMKHFGVKNHQVISVERLVNLVTTIRKIK